MTLENGSALKDFSDMVVHKEKSSLSEEQSIEKTSYSDGKTWINLTNPSQQDCKQVAEEHNVPLNFLLAALDSAERPRIDEEDGTCFILIRASTDQVGSRTSPYITSPIGIMINNTHIITVCNKPGLVNSLAEKKNRYSAENSNWHILLNLLFSTATQFINHLRMMLDATQTIEITLQKSMQNKELLSLLHMEKALVYFITSLRGNATVFEKLIHNNPCELSKREKNFAEAAYIENKQAVDMAEVFSAILGSLGDTFGAIVSNNLNKVMKFLTSVTIVLMIPTLVAGIYGMNVPLPWQDQQSAFAGISVGICCITILTWIYFWKKDWL